jgi:hypothetical protein
LFTHELAADDEDMPPLPWRCLIVSQAHARETRLATERDRRDAHRALENGLRDLRRHARWRRGPALEVQPLIQLVRAANCVTFRTRRERAWQGTEYSTTGVREGPGCEVEVGPGRTVTALGRRLGSEPRRVGA